MPKSTKKGPMIRTPRPSVRRKYDMNLPSIPALPRRVAAGRLAELQLPAMWTVRVPRGVAARVEANLRLLGDEGRWHPLLQGEHPDDWTAENRRLAAAAGLGDEFAMLKLCARDPRYLATETLALYLLDHVLGAWMSRLTRAPKPGRREATGRFLEPEPLWPEKWEVDEADAQKFRLKMQDAIRREAEDFRETLAAVVYRAGGKGSGMPVLRSVVASRVDEIERLLRQARDRLGKRASERDLRDVARALRLPLQLVKDVHEPAARPRFRALAMDHVADALGVEPETIRRQLGEYQRRHRKPRAAAK